MVRKLSVRLVSVVMGLVVSTVLTGSLHAGSLEPPGPPAPTMKTLDQIVPTWDQVLPAAQRFQSVMGGAAILDKETGLVWEKDPFVSTRNWSDARGQCTSRITGGRKGWRLPSMFELASLVDPARVNPALPMDHPFTNVQSFFYWSATTSAENSQDAYGVGIGNASFGQNGKTFAANVWCVRGAWHADTY